MKESRQQGCWPHSQASLLSREVRQIEKACTAVRGCL